jgi:hypothetical protein
MPTCLHVGTIVFDHDIRGRDQPLEDREPFRRLQVEAERPLVAVQVLHVEAMPVAAHAFIGIDARRRLDLQHVGPEVRENTDTCRACPHPGEVEHAQIGQSFG